MSRLAGSEVFEHEFCSFKKFELGSEKKQLDLKQRNESLNIELQKSQESHRLLLEENLKLNSREIAQSLASTLVRIPKPIKLKIFV